MADLWARRKDGDLTVSETVEQSAVLLSFLACPTVQWVFILTATDKAQIDETLGHIAAGPVEQLLGKHGDEFIELVEREAGRAEKFARMMTGVWRHTMNAQVWSRVEAIKMKAVASDNQL